MGAHYYPFRAGALATESGSPYGAPGERMPQPGNSVADEPAYFAVAQDSLDFALSRLPLNAETT
jgi:hypothetical protein